MFHKGLSFLPLFRNYAGQQKERWQELCELAAQEQNPERLMELVAESNRLLEQKEQRRTQATGQFRVVNQLPNSIPSARSLPHRYK
jgi:hypothetical protein